MIIRLLLLALGWAVLAFSLHQAFTVTIEEQGLWDPYDILGVSTVRFFLLDTHFLLTKLT
jgi:preprotein translocase subunit Sec63